MPRVSNMAVQETPIVHGELWSARQNQGNPIHGFSYRGCYKSTLPSFFISRLTKVGDTVYDPFMGRGTTLLEAALMGRSVSGSDANPISPMIVAPRLSPPSMDQIKERLNLFKWGSWARRMGRWQRKNPIDFDDLSPFFHKETLADVLMLREALSDCDVNSVEGWIRMVVMAILTGHSPGFLSRYSLPPGNTASPDAQRNINAKYDRAFERKDVSALIEAKSARFLAGGGVADVSGARLFVRSADDLSLVSCNSVQLVMTSPPFVDVIDYAKENWMRMWFAGVAGTYSAAIQAQCRFPQIWNSSSMSGWEDLMNGSMREMMRILTPGGFAAIEVGEIRKGSEPLDDRIARLATAVGFIPISVFINAQKFTKAAHIWGVNNQVGGTNTNRIVLLRKPGGPLFDYAGTFSNLSL